MHAAFAVFVWIGSIAAIVTPLVYGLCNRWWTNYWGRTLLFKDIVLALVYARSLINLNRTPTRSGLVSVGTLVITILMGVALAANLAVMIVVTFRSPRYRRVPAPK